MVEIIYPARLPDTYTADFNSLYPEVTYPHAGFVTGLSAIAFLASRSEWFAGATMAYEALEYATRDSIFASGVWLSTQENLLHYFPETEGLLVAEMALKHLIEAEQLLAIAKPVGGQTSEPIKAYSAADWSRTFERNMGLVLIPGYWDLKVEAGALRRSIPAPPAPAAKPRGTKFHNMAGKLRPVFRDRHDQLASYGSDHARAVFLADHLGRSQTWKGRAPDIKTLKEHWDHYLQTRPA